MEYFVKFYEYEQSTQKEELVYGCALISDKIYDIVFPNKRICKFTISSFALDGNLLDEKTYFVGTVMSAETFATLNSFDNIEYLSRISNYKSQNVIAVVDNPPYYLLKSEEEKSRAIPANRLKYLEDVEMLFSKKMPCIDGLPKNPIEVLHLAAYCFSITNTDNKESAFSILKSFFENTEHPQEKYAYLSKFYVPLYYDLKEMVKENPDDELAKKMLLQIKTIKNGLEKFETQYDKLIDCEINYRKSLCEYAEKTNEERIALLPHYQEIEKNRNNFLKTMSQKANFVENLKARNELKKLTLTLDGKNPYCDEEICAISSIMRGSGKAESLEWL